MNPSEQAVDHAFRIGRKLAAEDPLTKPYDWDDYRSDWKPNAAYVEQEDELREMIEDIRPAPKSVLEIGPGFGRITRLVDLTLSDHEVDYRALDVSAVALHDAQLFVHPSFEFDEVIVQPIQHPDLGPHLPKADLVIAIEVLMHIPPSQVQQAVDNMLLATKPGGTLITCDWTRNLGRTPIRDRNYRHEYHALFDRAGNKVGRPMIIRSRGVGSQTIYAVTP